VFFLTNVQSWSPGHSGYFWSVNASSADDTQSPSSSNSSLPPSSSPSSAGTPSTWRHLIDRESERLAKQQEERLFTPTKANCKDDTTSWLPTTGWQELFKGKDLKVLLFLKLSFAFVL
jgi:hypothetical protein